MLPGRKQTGLMPETPYRIWIAEDNPADVYLIEEALRRHQFEYRLETADNGEDMLKMIAGVDQDPSLSCPDLFLIDLNLPRRPGDEVLAAWQFVFDSQRVRSNPELAAYARESFPEGRPLLAAALDLMRRIHQDFRFDKKATEVATPVQTFFEKRRGVCQDFAHLQIGCMRSLGLPARYVSGYLRTMPPPGRPRIDRCSDEWLRRAASLD